MYKDMLDKEGSFWVCRGRRPGARGQESGAVATHVLNPKLTPNLERPSSVDSARARQSHAPTGSGDNVGASVPHARTDEPAALEAGVSASTSSVQASHAPTLDCVFGDLDYVDAEDTSRVVRAWRSKPYEAGAFQRGWHPAHPSFFVKRSVYERFGLFDTKLKIAADYEFMLRVLEREQLSSAYLPEVIVKMRMGARVMRRC